MFLTYQFKDDGEAKYRQLYSFIREDIERGRLAAEAKLPSKRALARHLGISVLTVENAYSKLAAEGYIAMFEKRGSFVLAQGQSNIDKSRNLLLDQKKKRNSKQEENQKYQENFPFATWAKCARKSLQMDRKALLTPTDAQGSLILRQAISRYIRNFRGIEAEPEQIIIGAGAQILYTALVQILGREKIYAVENPSYPKIAAAYRNQGTRVVAIDIDNYGVSSQKLNESMASVLHISPNHQFPSGVVMPINRRYEILAWANSGQGKFIVEDDYDSEFRFDGEPLASLYSLDKSGKVIYANTFSKTLSSTLRIAYLILPIELLEQYQNSFGIFSCTVSNFEQLTLARFINNGYFEEHINRMRNFYRLRREEVLSKFRNCPLAEECEIIEGQAGLHFVLQCKKNAAEFTGKARAYGFNVRNIADFYLDLQDKENNQQVLLDYSNFVD
ncbi:MAG: PLP-dependent aminotransferase family protein [Cardiobacteriaceae bacterium]|nr:PLP-dependent aminotransferase family protein [Cardiobacteriaceae bacterium]